MTTVTPGNNHDHTRFFFPPKMQWADEKELLSFDDVLLEPQYGVLAKRGDADTSTYIFKDVSLAVPILSANMPAVTEGAMAQAMAQAGGIGVIHRFQKVDDRMNQWYQSDHKSIISLGLKEMSAFYAFYHQGARLFCLDVAHGHHEQVGAFIRLIKTYSEMDDIRLMVGNVATAQGAMFLIQEGADAIKVGIGPGAACRTREVTGFGVPQLSAIVETARVAQGYEVPVIADGGIKSSGDIVKALAAGASAVMIGSMLAGADEAPSPGEYYGNASNRLNGHRAPEGVQGNVPLKGPVEDIIKELVWGIRSGISYAGATNLKELRENARWIRVAPGVAQESHVRV